MPSRLSGTWDCQALKSIMQSDLSCSQSVTAVELSRQYSCQGSQAVKAVKLSRQSSCQGRHPPAVETLHLEIVTTFYRTLSRISTKNWVMARFLKYPLK